jgi:DNA repair photolyase
MCGTRSFGVPMAEFETVSRQSRRGRGALSNADGRFEPYAHAAEDDGWGSADAPLAPLRTIVQEDRARTVIVHQKSPDVPFEQSINPYRGCEHGCVYCFARPSHAYLGLSPGLDFETRLFAKPDAAKVLMQELRRPAYKVSPIAFGTNTDPYQPVERRLRIMRSLMEVLARCEHPFTIVTKSALVERDIDLLAPMAVKKLVQVFLSVTTLDRGLARTLEPRAAAPQRRVETLRALANAGVPVGVLVAPVIPALTDHELESILESCTDAGATEAGYVLLRLPHEVKDLFQEWLATHQPRRAAHVMNLVRAARGGKEYDATFGTRMRGSGEYAALLGNRFRLACRRLGLNRQSVSLDVTRFQPPPPDDAQLSLF